MIQMIKKEVLDNFENSAKKILKLAIKLVSFVISCWLVIGMLAIGLIVPVEIVKFVTNTEWTKETKTVNIEKKNERAMGQHTPVIYSYPNVRNYESVSVMKREQEQFDLKNGLRNTRNTVSELRGLANGLEAFVSR